MFWISEGHHLASKPPVHKVFGGIARDVTALWIVSLGAIFSKPVIHSLPLENPATVRLYLLAAVIEPHRAGMHDRWLSPSGNCGNKQSKYDGMPDFDHFSPYSFAAIVVPCELFRRVAPP
jgi:hypothetical protein